MQPDTKIQLPDAVARARAESDARKIFRLRCAMEVLGNADLHKFAATSKEGASKADALIRRATEVSLAYLNED